MFEGGKRVRIQFYIHRNQLKHLYYLSDFIEMELFKFTWKMNGELFQ